MKTSKSIVKYKSQVVKFDPPFLKLLSNKTDIFRELLPTKCSPLDNQADLKGPNLGMMLNATFESKL